MNRLLALLALTAAAPSALAGRPVFHELTLEEAVRASGAVVVARPLSPLIARSGCLATFRFELRELLSNPGGLPLPPAGRALAVTDRGLSSQLDCEARRDGSKGTSFAARLYRRQGEDLDLGRMDEAILFLSASPQPGELRFTVDRAWESPEAKKAVTRLLGAGGPVRRTEP